MSKQKLRDNEEIIIAMREAGKSRQEIADELGLTNGQRKDYELMDKNRVTYYKRQFRLTQSENKRLKMENELMRDFLSLTGRE